MPDPTPTALDALLAEVEGASKWMTHATRDYLARTAAPRLAAQERRWPRATAPKGVVVVEAKKVEASDVR